MCRLFCSFGDNNRDIGRMALRTVPLARIFSIAVVSTSDLATAGYFSDGVVDLCRKLCGWRLIP